MRIFGVDFTSAPCARKPITIAQGRARGSVLTVSAVAELERFALFEKWLETPGPWIAGFDFPFGISRQAVCDLSWPQTWLAMLEHCAALGRARFKEVLDAYRESRPHGDRYAKRRGDSASGAHPSVKLVNPPVGFMFLEGARRLALAGLHIPGLHQSASTCIALEAYPGLLVRQLGVRESYKSDDARKHTSRKRAARKRILEALEDGRPLDVRLRLPAPLRSRILRDGSGDLLDAVICALQAHWGWLRRDRNYGLPDAIDPLEGWIVTAVENVVRP